LSSNYFFYDGLYWVYQSDHWYASSWYNGPWALIGPEAVPLYVLRVPVRYYRRPPPYFRGWHADAPPRWDDHWGHEWKQSRTDWDRWDRHTAPPRAPLPTYQRQYSGDRYPPAVQQPVLQAQKYKYRPHDPVTQQHYQSERTQGVSASTSRGSTDGKPPQAARGGGLPPEPSAPRPADQGKGAQGQGPSQSSNGGHDKGGGKGNSKD
jgi:hypothetical protein